MNIANDMTLLACVDMYLLAGITTSFFGAVCEFLVDRKRANA